MTKTHKPDVLLHSNKCTLECIKDGTTFDYSKEEIERMKSNPEVYRCCEYGVFIWELEEEKS